MKIKTWYIATFAYDENRNKQYITNQFSSEKRGEDLIMEIRKTFSKTFFEQGIFTENGKGICIINLTDIS